MSQRLKIAGLIAIIVVSFSYAIGKGILSKPQRRPNVFIISFCSFRMQALKRWGGEAQGVLPAMEKFMDGASYVFDNVVNGMPWTGVFTFTRQRIPPKTFLDLGYHFLGSVEAGHLERIPNRHSFMKGYDFYQTNDNDYEKDIAGITEYVSSLASSASMQPFFGNIHYKYMHFPFIDRFNADSEWDQFLTVDERNRISEYLNHPEKYPEKMPFLMLLKNDPNIALVHPEIKPLHWKEDPVSLKELTGLFTNPRFIKAWKESPGYAEDKRLLEAVYRANLKYLDQVLAAPLGLWGNKDLEDNTVVIMMADHGEMHMERDQLTHGSILYDEALRVPMAIHFPGHWGRTKIVSDQMHFATIAKLVEGIIKGEIREDNLPEKIPTLGGDTVVLRDCLNTLRGLRVKNKYKYFVKIASGERFLFDLEKDPKESTNIADANPDLTDSLEAQYWEKYPEFSDIYPYHCAPWGSDQQIAQ